MKDIIRKGNKVVLKTSHWGLPSGTISMDCHFRFPLGRIWSSPRSPLRRLPGKLGRWPRYRQTEKSELHDLRLLNPDVDIQANYNYRDTHVWFADNGAIYRAYLANRTRHNPAQCQATALLYSFLIFRLSQMGEVSLGWNNILCGRGMSIGDILDFQEKANALLQKVKVSILTFSFFLLGYPDILSTGIRSCRCRKCHNSPRHLLRCRPPAFCSTESVGHCHSRSCPHQDC